MNRSMKNIALALVLVTFSAQAAKNVKNRKMQILVNASTATFRMNESLSTGFVTNLYANRSIGAGYLLNGWVFERRTIGKKQTSYLVDKKGHTLTASDSIGNWWANTSVIAAINFTTGLTPLVGQTVELATWNFLFKKRCDGENNTITGIGSSKIETNKLGQPSFDSHMQIVEAIGCNANNNSSYKAVAYFDAANNMLINIKFENEVEYKD